MTVSNNREAVMELCAREEEELRFQRLTNEDALHLGLAIAEEAKRRGVALTIRIERNQQELFHYAMPGTAADNDTWVRRKCALVNRVGKSSYHYKLWLESRGQAMRDRALDDFIYAAAGGAFPIHVQNVGVVGAVAVSGLPQEEDHKFVVSSVEKFLLGK